MRLRDMMTVGIQTIGPDETASAARTKMKRHRIRHLVVVDGDPLDVATLDQRIGAVYQDGMKVV